MTAAANPIWPAEPNDPITTAQSLIYQVQAVAGLINDAVGGAPPEVFELNGRTIDVLSLVMTVELLVASLEDSVETARVLVSSLRDAAGEGGDPAAS